jgi:hypothetical protein
LLIFGEPLFLLAGSVIVSTPQNVALIDTRKGVAMFRKLDIPVSRMKHGFPTTAETD